MSKNPTYKNILNLQALLTLNDSSKRLAFYKHSFDLSFISYISNNKYKNLAFECLDDDERQKIIV
jgi:hypothetical protein